MKAVLKEHYQKNVVPELMKTHGYTNVHEVPQVIKIVLNTGFDASVEKSGLEEIQKELSNIAGQRAILTRAKNSISNFKLREEMPIGAKVTLRGASMYNFLYRLLAVALPGIRDFRGVNSKLDGNGNYTLGITDHTIFPESHGDSSRRVIGMDISIVTTASTDDEGRELLRLMGMPFRKRAGDTSTSAAQQLQEAGATAENQA